MMRFLVRRVLYAALVLYAIATVVFLLFFVASPGDKAALFAGRQATAEQIAAVRRELGFDRPVFEQYLAFMSRLLHGDLGISYRNGEPVLSTILDRLPVTTSLAIGAAIIWLVIGVSIGVLAARRPRSIADRLATVFALAGLAMPTFLLGLLLFYFLFFKLTQAGLPLFPGFGYIPLTENPLEWLRHLVLPWLTVALVYAAIYSRLTRSSLLEVMGEDYIRTARAKGLSERTVVYRHGLRAAIAPVVTLLGVDLGTLLGGAIVTEQVFSLPGIGKLAVDSVLLYSDLPVVMGVVIFAAFFIVAANVIVDLLYAVLDPRVRLG